MTSLAKHLNFVHNSICCKETAQAKEIPKPLTYNLEALYDYRNPVDVCKYLFEFCMAISKCDIKAV